MEDECVFFKDSFSVRDLVGEDGAVFEVLQEGEEEVNNSPNYATPEEYAQAAEATNYEELDEDVDENLRGHPGLFTFTSIATKMTNLTKDGSVKKLCLRRGFGPDIPGQALLDFHYQAYFEGSDEPFDSTYLRGRPERFSLGAGLLVPGLQISLASMKKKELSRFLVQPEMAYGKMGIPPRIPGNAEILFDVELLNFIEGVEAEALLANENENPQSFETVYKAAFAKYLEGNEFNKKTQFQVAISKYQRVRNLLESARVANEDEESRQKKFLLKIYTNLAISYNRTQSPRKACTMSQLALRIDQNHCKALFAYGRAQLMLHDYRRSKEFLNRALKIEPQNPEINAEILKVIKREKEAAELEKVNCARMFNLKVTPKEKSQVDADMKEFRSEIEEIIKNFIHSLERTETFPAGMTTREEAYVEEEARRLGLVFKKNRDKSITLCKD